MCTCLAVQAARTMRGTGVQVDSRRRSVLALAGAAILPRAQSALGAVLPVVGLADGRNPRFVAALEDLGWVDGKNIRLVDPQRGPASREAVDQLIRMRVDMMVTSTDLSVRWASTGTRTIPIVALLQFPLQDGFVRSLSRPGGNVTGFTTYHADIYGKCLQLLKQALPRARTIALMDGGEGVAELIDLETMPLVSESPGLKSAARSLELRLVRAPLSVTAIRTADTQMMGAAVAAAVRLGAEALVMRDLIFMTKTSHAERFHGACLRHRLPAMHMHLAAESGGLLAYGVSASSVLARLAYYADKVLRGTRPGDLPIEQWDRRELHVNLRTASLLGIEIPRALLLQADRVFE